ncbi:MAG: hypothetical protein JEZ06_22225 [Anaerolineaceae bacterium]|nr:hypothetical protein [Anaerolineaceae bacterium]
MKNNLSFHVHLLQEPEPESFSILKSALNENIVLSTGNKLISNAQFNILVGGRPNKDHLESSPYLNTLIIPFAGLPDETCTLMQDYPQISVHNLHHNAGLTAEMALALLLGVSRKIIPFDKAFRKNDWRMRYTPNDCIFLDGKTVLILGFGNIGIRLSKMLLALNMKVVGIKRSVSSASLNQKGICIATIEKLHQYLPQADVLVTSLPLTGMCQ